MTECEGLLAASRPAEIYECTAEGLEQVGDALTDDEGAVLDTTDFDGTTYVGTTSHQGWQQGVGEVYTFDGDAWQAIGQNLNSEVTALQEYRDDLYAVTSGDDGEIYRFDGEHDWTRVVHEPDWEGFTASIIYEDRLFVGDGLHDVFGFYDGTGFHLEADKGGSCIYDFVEHNEHLLAGAYSGLVYRRGDQDWPVEVDVGIDDVFELESHDGTLYMGMEGGDLLEYDMDTGDWETVAQFENSVSSLISEGEELLVGVGSNAAQYGSWLDEGVAGAYRVDEGGVVEEIPGVNDVAGAIQQFVDSDGVEASGGTHSTHATALTYIPGHSENAEEGGSMFDCAIPDWVEWFHGDVHPDGLEQRLEDATAQDKYLAEYAGEEYAEYEFGGGDGFPHYRVKNSIDVTVESADGQTVDDYDVSESHDLAPITLEGETLADGSTEWNPIRDEVPHWFEENDRFGEPWDYQKSTPKGEWYAEEPVSVDGVQGVRASYIVGGSDDYLDVMRERLFAMGEAAFLAAMNLEARAGLALIQLLSNLPVMYTFVEVTLMADGSSLARIWDGGLYPRHALYTGSDEAGAEKRGHSNFEEGEHWRPNQFMPDRFFAWGQEKQIPGASPYAPGGKYVYLANFWSDVAIDTPDALDLDWEADDFLTPPGTPNVDVSFDHPLAEHAEAGEVLDEDALIGGLRVPLVPDLD